MSVHYMRVVLAESSLEHCSITANPNTPKLTETFHSFTSFALQFYFGLGVYRAGGEYYLQLLNSIQTGDGTRTSDLLITKRLWS
jgi:hypothetical protein